MEQFLTQFTDLSPDIFLSNYVIIAFLAFFFILASQLLAWFIKRLFKTLIAKAGQSKNQWDNIILEAAVKPVSISIKLIGLLLALAVITTEIENELFRSIVSNSYVIFIPIGSWFLTRLVFFYEQAYLKKEAAETSKSTDVTTVQTISKLIRLSIIIITILLVLQNLGVNITGLVAAGGVGGLAIGFAAQDLLANLFGGLMLYLEKPFKIGDWIRSPDREIEGTVVDIGLRTTVIQTFDHRPLYVPNAIFTKIAVENPSRMKNRRIYETIGVRYQDVAAIEPMLTDIRQHLAQSKDIDTNLINMVYFDSFAPSSLDFFIYCFTATKEWEEFHRVKEQLLLEISKIITRHNAEVAFPTSTIHLQSPDNLARMPDNQFSGSAKS